MLRTELQLFNPLVGFLTKAISSAFEGGVDKGIYKDDTIAAILNLLVNAIDTNKSN
jgi:hypothetical protein